MLGAHHVEHQEQPVSMYQSEHLVSAPIHEGRVEQARLGWDCDLYHATVGFTCLLISLMQPHRASPPSCPPINFLWKSGCRDVNCTVQVHKAKRVHAVWRIQASLMIHAVPWEQFGSPAAMQPGVHASPCECSLAVFSSLGPGIKPWVLGERIGFPFCFFFYIFLRTHPILQHCKMKALPVVCFVSCWGEGQKELGEIKQWKLEWNGGVWKTRDNWDCEKQDQAWERKALLCI